MAKEIEVKYIVDMNRIDTSKFQKAKIVTQGYLNTADEHAVRVNIMAPIQLTGWLKGTIRYNDIASKINVKGPRKGATRDEFEYSIPPKDALDMINMTKHRIHKLRLHHESGWDVDIYYGKNFGLVVAEKEYPSEEELKADTIPDWCVLNVTDDDRFYNKNLSVESFYKCSDRPEILERIYGDGGIREKHVNMECMLMDCMETIETHLNKDHMELDIDME